MSTYDDQDDLDKWLARQQAPSLEASQPAAAEQQQPGAWARAAQMLGGDRSGGMREPAPKPSTLDSWSTILGMLASRDPGSVLANDAANRRAAVDAFQRRQDSREQQGFQRQLAASGLLMQEDAAKHALEAQQFQQDRATAADIEHAAETEWSHGHTEKRDKATDQHWSAEEQRARDQMAQSDQHFNVEQGGMDRRQDRALSATRTLHDLDNANDLEKARIAAGAKAAENAVPAIPGFVTDNPDVMGKLGKTPEGYRKLADDVAMAKRAREIFSQLKTLRAADYSKANEAAYNSLIKMAIGDRSKEGSTGALTGTEYERYFTDFPAYTRPGAALSSWGAALDTLRGKNVGDESLTAIEKALGDTSRVKLSTYGGHLDDGTAPPAPPPAAAAPPPPAATDVLPVTNQRRADIPKVNDYLRKLAEDDADLGVTYGR